MIEDCPTHGDVVRSISGSEHAVIRNKTCAWDRRAGVGISRRLSRLSVGGTGFHVESKAVRYMRRGVVDIT